MNLISKDMRPEHEGFLNLTIFQRRVINGKARGNKTVVTTCIPISLRYHSTAAYQYQKLIDTTITESVISRLEELQDERTVQAMEYHLAEQGLSLSRLCQQAQKISDVFYSMFQESAGPVVEEILKAAYQTFGFKYAETNNLISDNLKLAQSLADLKRGVIEQGLQSSRDGPTKGG